MADTPTSKERIAALRATIHMLQARLDRAGNDLALARDNEMEAEMHVAGLMFELRAAENALEAMEQ